MYRAFFKPLLDRVTAFFLLILLSPFLILIALVNQLSRQAVFFSQTRPGLNASPFQMLKFTTMNDHRDEVGELLSDAHRMTVIGRFIRKTSLDELPQLINVIRGEMSIVGPRPLLTEYIGIYSADQARRHLVRPGITGWAQVNGRNAISWKDKLAMDVWYVDHQTFLLDLKILFLTLIRVLMANGINAPGSVTTEKFNGKN